MIILWFIVLFVKQFYFTLNYKNADCIVLCNIHTEYFGDYYFK